MQHNNNNNQVNKEIQRQIDTLTCYHNYGDDQFWDLRTIDARGKPEIQLCSPLFDNRSQAGQLLNLIHSVEDQANHPGFQLVASQSAPGKFRVVAFLANINVDLTKSSAEKKQVIIVNFFNDNFLPMDVFQKEAYKSFNKTDRFYQQKWQIENGHVIYLAPSVYEVCYGNEDRHTDIAEFLKKKMLTVFENNNELQEQRGKMATAFLFKNNLFFYTTVYNLARQHDEKIKNNYRGVLTVHALNEPGQMLPNEALYHVGFFVREEDTRALACVNKAAAGVAREFNNKYKQ